MPEGSLQFNAQDPSLRLGWHYELLLSSYKKARQIVILARPIYYPIHDALLQKAWGLDGSHETQRIIIKGGKYNYLRFCRLA